MEELSPKPDLRAALASALGEQAVPVVTSGDVGDLTQSTSQSSVPDGGTVRYVQFLNMKFEQES